MTSTGTLGSGPGASVRKLEQTLVISSFFPDNYSLLTRSVKCTFCHASFQSMDALGDDPEDTPWKHTSVRVLDILQTRGSSGGDFDTDTVIHGSLYSRGNTANWQGSVNFGALASSLTTTFDGGEGINITSSNKRSLSGEITDCSTISNCPEKGFAPFYKNYPTQKPPGRGWPGAELPGEFPKPIPDTNGNNLVDDIEWDNFVAGLTDSGSITGSFKNYSSDLQLWRTLQQLVKR